MLLTGWYSNFPAALATDAAPIDPIIPVSMFTGNLEFKDKSLIDKGDLCIFNELTMDI